MARVSIADRGRLSWLVARRRAHHLVARGKAHSLTQIIPWPGRAERLVIAPQEIRTADPTRATEIYSGRFALAGKVVVCDSRSPFDMIPPSDEWAESLLGFGWLRHLRAAESGITTANARALVDEWITIQGGWHPIAWRPEIVARRVISWLTQATLILDDADVRFYRRFLRSLTRQVRYLRGTAADAHDGVPRLQARIALTYASLCMAGQIRHLKKLTRKLTDELDRQILPDGGHVSRNPGALIELMLDLMPLSHAFTARNIAPPRELVGALDRMMPMLRFFRHGDGAFALYNGMGPTPSDLLATLLAYDDINGAPVSNAPHSGFQRLEGGTSLGSTVVIMDAGAPPPFDLSANAHAGCLSFEFSAKQQRIVVNCGLPASGRDNWRQVARATAAHSTMTINDTSSCQFVDTSFRRAFGSPIAGGPTRVPVTREDHKDASVVRAHHDGYAALFGAVHQRLITLSVDGLMLEGEDHILPDEKQMFFPGHTPDDFAVRFHLHPLVRANRRGDEQAILLTLPNKDVWTFQAHDSRVEVEESVFLGGADGPRRTSQLVVYGHARQTPQVRWSFAFSSPQAPSSRRPREQTPELPL